VQAHETAMRAGAERTSYQAETPHHRCRVVCHRSTHAERKEVYRRFAGTRYYAIGMTHEARTICDARASAKETVPAIIDGADAAHIFCRAMLMRYDFSRFSVHFIFARRRRHVIAFDPMMPLSPARADARQRHHAAARERVNALPIPLIHARYC